jgi:coenzyme F420 hydrogenase subunit beta
MTELSPQEGLINQVIKRHICVVCGACAGYCPYFEYFDGRIVIMDRCNSERGRCHAVCPMAGIDKVSIDPDKPIGEFRKIYMARSIDSEIRKVAQYGGVVTSILIHVLDKGIISSAVVTSKGDKLSPGGMISIDRAQILTCSGSRYTGSGSLRELNLAIKRGVKSLGVVGLPCQMKAINKMVQMDEELPHGAISLKIGLFCTWALDYRSLVEYLIKDQGISKMVLRFDITPPPDQIFRVITKDSEFSIPIDSIRDFILQGCSLCDDMTAQFSDISVGAVEGMEGWNTVIVRSDRGEEIMESVQRDNMLELMSLPEENLSHLMEASLNKKRRAESNLKNFSQGLK